MVTVVPPATSPDVGVMPLTVGGAGAVVLPGFVLVEVVLLPGVLLLGVLLLGVNDVEGWNVVFELEPSE
jgi:hypothetical protein